MAEQRRHLAANALRRIEANGAGLITQQAEDQAGAPGYKPIDLIDGERLVEPLIEHRLGIKDVTVVDTDFFTPFQ